MPVEESIQWWHDSGVTRVGLANTRRTAEGWFPACEGVRAAGLELAYLLHASMYDVSDPSSFAQSSAALVATLDAAAEFGCKTVYTTTGRAGHLSVDEAIEQLAVAYVDVRAHAANLGVQVLVETTAVVYREASFLHSLADTLTAAKRVGLGVCLDLHATWAECWSQDHLLKEALPMVSLIQVAGSTTAGDPSRLPLGEGSPAIADLVRRALALGYRGLVDLELYNRPVETARVDTASSVAELEKWLIEAASYT